MATPKFKPDSKMTFWNVAFGLLSCALPFILAFLPDEKLVRHKLQGLEILVFLWLSLLGLKVFFNVRIPFPWNFREWVRSSPLTATVFLWMAVMGGLWWLAPEKSLASMELRRVLLAGAFFLCFSQSRLTPVWRSAFFGSWWGAAGLMAAYGILQRTGGFGALQVPQMDRVMGTFGNPIFFAAFLTASLFMGWAWLRLVSGAGFKLVVAAGLLVQLVAVAFTETRAAWIALAGAVVVGIFMVVRGRRAWIALSIVAAFLVVFFLVTRDVWLRDQAHLLIWRDTARMAMHHPVAGVGLGSFHTNFPQHAGEDLITKWPTGRFIVNYAHNEYLQMFAEGGVLSLGAFLAVLGFFVRTVRRRMSLAPPDPVLMPIFLAACALLIQNLFSVDMRFSITFGLLFALMGIVEGLASHDRDQLSPRGPLPTGEWILRGLAGAVWLSGMILIVRPALLHPYQAQKSVAQQVDFFDERLLDPAATLAQLEEFTRRYPDEALVWERYAYALAKEIKTADGKINPARAAQSIDAYRRVTGLKPDYANAYNNLGNIFFTIGREEDALEAWRHAARLAPDFVPVHLNLGKVLYTKGRLKESAQHFEHVLKTDPKNHEAAVYLKRMVE